MTGLTPEQERALELRFAAARARSDASPLRVLGIGDGVGQWEARFDPAETRFSGMETEESGAGDYGVSLPYDPESFDLVFGVNVVQREPDTKRKNLLSEIWRVARSGGELVFVEDFVVEERSPIRPVSVTEFERLLLEATAGRVVLMHVESFRYPGEVMFRSGLISCLRLANSRR